MRHMRYVKAYCSFKLCPIFVLVLLLKCVPGQDLPPNPCPQIFQYQYDRTEWIGIVQLTGAQLGQTIRTNLNLSLRGRLPTTYPGSLELYFTRDQTLQNIVANKPIVYKVRFPVQSPLPRLTQILVNNRAVCAGAADYGSAVTSLKLEHTLRTQLATDQLSNRPSSNPVYQIYVPDEDDATYIIETSSNLGQGDKNVYIDAYEKEPQGPLAQNIFQPSKGSPVASPPKRRPTQTITSVSNNSPSLSNTDFILPNYNQVSSISNQGLTSSNQGSSNYNQGSSTSNFNQGVSSSNSNQGSGQSSNNPFLPQQQQQQQQSYYDQYETEATTRPPNRKKPSSSSSSSDPNRRPSSSSSSQSSHSNQRPSSSSSQSHRKPSTSSSSSSNTSGQRKPTTNQRKPSSSSRPSSSKPNRGQSSSSNLYSSSEVLTDYNNNKNPSHTDQKPTNKVDAINKVCGVVDPKFNIRPLVVGGEELRRGTWPWLAAIYLNKQLSLSFQCGGNLISNRLVLTSAHCFFANSKMYTASNVIVFLGRHNIQDWNEQGFVSSSADGIFVHPDYKNNLLSYDADIALVLMKNDIKFTEVIKPVCLWPKTTKTDDIIGETGVIVGWGKNAAGQLTTTPKRVTSKVVSDIVCIRSNEQFRVLTSNRTFCAGNRDGNGPCNGDSGGGLMIRRSNKWWLRGTVSASLSDPVKNTCNLKQYVVYADVAKFLDWVHSYMLL